MPTYNIDIPAGPLWSNDEAQKIGQLIATAHQARFTGQWRTVVPGQMSVIGVELPTARTGQNEILADLPAGPLWSNDEAQKIGPNIAASYGGEFTGQWRTVMPGVMSVVQVRFRY